MKTKSKISLDELKLKSVKAKKINADEYGTAAFSHYLYNHKNGVSKFYKKTAVDYIKRELEYKYPDEKITSKLAEEALQYLIFDFKHTVPFPEPELSSFKFIDLFAGIGGFRIAMQSLGGKCVFTSEWDEQAKKTYEANFGEVPFGDITKEETKKFIPKDFDVLCAGFPCQAFSIAGNRKGFADTRGTLFFDIEQIIEKHRPKVIFLENVKNLVSHDNGKTFKTILDILEKKLKYKVFYKVLNTATHANIPQNRERIFIVAFDPLKVKNYNNFKFPEPIKLTKTIHSCLEKGKVGDEYYYSKDHPYYEKLKQAIVSKDTIYQWRRVYARENKSKLCPTLTANMGTGGHNVPLINDGYGIRKLTPGECFAFQGYPLNKYKLPPIAKSKLYMQAGNSVTTTLIERIAKNIIDVL